MGTNSQKTEKQERIEKASAIMKIKFAQVKENTLAYWHYKTLASAELV